MRSEKSKVNLFSFYIFTGNDNHFLIRIMSFIITDCTKWQNITRTCVCVCVGEKLQFIFRNINHKDPQSAYTFLLRINEDGVYKSKSMQLLYYHAQKPSLKCLRFKRMKHSCPLFTPRALEFHNSKQGCECVNMQNNDILLQLCEDKVHHFASVIYMCINTVACVNN